MRWCINGVILDGLGNIGGEVKGMGGEEVVGEEVGLGGVDEEDEMGMLVGS